MSFGEYIRMLSMFSALAEPNRLRIVALLRAGPRAVGDIGESLQLRQPQVSKHLQHLKEAGLVTVEPVAQQRLYALRAEPFRELDAWLQDYRGLWVDRFRALDGVIERIKRREAEDETTKEVRHERRKK
jgi:DNA-binding transcriptional ArsR family regulator